MTLRLRRRDGSATSSLDALAHKDRTIRQLEAEAEQKEHALAGERLAKKRWHNTARETAAELANLAAIASTSLSDLRCVQCGRGGCLSCGCGCHKAAAQGRARLLEALAARDRRLASGKRSA